MSWLFLPGGLLMPSEFPADLVDAKWLGINGDFDIQVRARVESHLTNFIRDYMEPMGFAFSEIQATPSMDYNFRFYARRADFAQAVAQTILDIDYEKFKPTAENRDADGTPLYAGGKVYHTLLNNIWGSVCALNSPGGTWGAYSTTNHNGYKSTAEFNKKYGLERDDDYSNWRAGDSFRNVSQRDRDSEWYSTDINSDLATSTPDDVQDIVSQMTGIPFDQWEDFLADWEIRLIEPWMTQIRREKIRDERRTRRPVNRRNKRKQKGGNRHGNITQYK